MAPHARTNSTTSSSEANLELGRMEFQPRRERNFCKIPPSTSLSLRIPKKVHASPRRELLPNVSRQLGPTTKRSLSVPGVHFSDPRFMYNGEPRFATDKSATIHRRSKQFPQSKPVVSHICVGRARCATDQSTILRRSIRLSEARL